MPPAAIAPLRQAVRLAPDEPLIRIMLAQALLGTNDPKLVDEAITNLRTALAREDSSAMGYRQLAAAYARKADLPPGGRRQEAILGAGRACIGGGLFL